jgi:hypothetical protein
VSDTGNLSPARGGVATGSRPETCTCSDEGALGGAFIPHAKGDTMLWTIVAILLILWLLGFSTAVAGNLIHLLLVIALVVFILQMMQGRRPM